MTPTEQQKQALQGALDIIEKDHGKGAIMDMTGPIERVPAISTGALPLDIALGIGGVPQGRIIEIFGPESSGKTTLCYHLMAEVQRDGGLAAFIDTEHAMDAAYASSIGVDIENLVVSQPDFGEQALQIAETLVASGAVKLIVIDSVAALTPKAEIEGQIGDVTVGAQARMMSQAMRKLAGKASQAGTTLVFTNQIREKIGVMFGSPETQPGGRALKFYSSVRMDIRRIETIKDGQEAVGNKVRVKIVKNKVAPPYRQAEFVIAFPTPDPEDPRRLVGGGVDRSTTLIELDLAEKLGGVEKSGAWFTFTADGVRVQGISRAKAHLDENPEIADAIERNARAQLLGLAPVASVEEVVAEEEGDPEPIAS